MPTLVVENVPADVYERLKKRAAAERRSLPEETLHMLTQLMREDTHPAPRLPDPIPVEEVSAHYDLPRFSQPVATTAYHGQPRLPDPLTAEHSGEDTEARAITGEDTAAGTIPAHFRTCRR